jgi:flagellar motor switch protein FliG
LPNLFKGDKMRHNSAPPLVQGRGLSREDFMRIYESMPDSARAQLFAGLDFKQKTRLLELLTPELKKEEAAATVAEPEWHAEDFLPEKDERKIARLRHVREVKQVRELYANFANYPARSLADVLESESASVAAVVLLQLAHKQASKVLSLMPDLRRGEVVRAMAAERQISSEALVALGKKDRRTPADPAAGRRTPPRWCEACE